MSDHFRQFFLCCLSKVPTANRQPRMRAPTKLSSMKLCFAYQFFPGVRTRHNRYKPTCFSWMSLPAILKIMPTKRWLSTSNSGHDTAEAVRAIADLRSPQTWYPQARRMQRKWVVHIGPTNSGKTYQALSRLAHAENGVYCGPLRLLAWEVHEKLCDGAINGHRVVCDLLTGQEQVLFANAMHRASTIEMVDLKTCVEVAVIDEVRPPRSFPYSSLLPP